MYAIVFSLPQNYDKLADALWWWVPTAIVYFAIGFILYRVSIVLYWKYRRWEYRARLKRADKYTAEYKKWYKENVWDTSNDRR